MGVVGAAGGLGGFLLPSLLGLLKDVTGTYATGFVVFGLTALFGMGVLASRRHDWRKEWASAFSKAERI